MDHIPGRQLHIGFLFNHDAAHQVSHIAPIIGAFREHYPQVHVLAFMSSEEQYDAVLRVVRTQTQRSFARVPLRTPRPLKRLFDLANSIAPLQRLFLLRKYCALFENLDCLVVPEMTSSWLKTRFGMHDTPLVLVPHGAGDRAVGFCDAIRNYDYVLLAGTKVRDRMLSTRLITKDNHCVIGYPKFDSVSSAPRRSLFDNDRPTVLYNPHFEPLLSSWYRMGNEVLEYFADNPDYNLICAPHVMLFRKRLHISLDSRCVRFARNAHPKFKQCPNIRFDAGSSDSINMSYVTNADIYLGDVSSQVYEFIRNPRPCIFLNSHNAAWRSDANYRHWLLGPVLQSVNELGAALAHVTTHHSEWIARQQHAFGITFNLTETSSSVRAANAIMEFLERSTHPVQGPRTPALSSPASSVSA